MRSLRYSFRTDWLFYLFLASYAYLIINMTVRLWLGDGINIFASYSDAATSAQFIADANKIYWSKSCFLFGTLLLTGLNISFRAAFGLGATFWAGSLILMFGATPNLIGALVLGILLVVQQIRRGAFFSRGPARG